MGYGWLVVLTVLLAAAMFLLIAAYVKLGRQKKLIRLQSNEIQKQIKELVQQNRLQEELNREKQQLISVVSHDLKGPFNRIFALMQLMNMENQNLTEDQKDYLGKIHQITADGMNMVRNLVDARRMEDQGIDLQKEKINLTALLNQLVKQYRVLAAKKKIEVSFVAPEKLELLGDRLYLSRIIENLISNALKFSEPAKQIAIGAEEHGNWIVLKVADQGPGLSTEDMNKLYLPFQKLSARPTGGESSTGLGLSIAKRLIEHMGGTISCESSPGRGTVFRVQLPKGIS